MRRLFSSFVVRVQVSDEYVTIGLIVLYKYVVIIQTNFGDRHVVRSAYHNTTAYILKSSRTESLK